jgi:hypothetical protein
MPGAQAGQGRRRRQQSSACGQLRIRSSIPQPRRTFKCQPRRKPARGGSPRVLARPLWPRGSGCTKLGRAPPCLWAGAARPHGRWLERDADRVRWERAGISVPLSGGLIWEQRPLRDGCEDSVNLLIPLPALTSCYFSLLRSIP